jgi:hypothetical protein
MKILALACFAAACATAAAAPPPAAPAGPAPAPRKMPPPKGCVARGTPMFELDHGPIGTAKQPSSTFKIHDSGAWTFESKDADGKAGEPQRGCFAGDDLTAIKADVSVPWKTSAVGIRCMAMSTTSDKVMVKGKLVFTEKVCNDQKLDDASAKALADLTAKMKTATGG